jgi:pimeloyl-ACP methyl ester carboxylesterase
VVQVQAHVIVTHGSEAGSRSHPGYVSWAEQIRARGIAVLVFDKRGVADSEGTYVEGPNLAVPAADVIAWFDLLKARDDLRPDRIGVLGWSQGGWTGPLAASQADLAYVVMISGPAVSPLEQNIYDKGGSVSAAAPSPADSAAAQHAVREVMTYLVKGGDLATAQAAWDAVAGESWFADNYQGIPMMDRDILLSDPRGAAFAVHNGYEPVPALSALRVPVLAVYGGSDRIVAAAESVEILEHTVLAAGSSLTTRIFPGADHGIAVRGPDGQRRPADGYHDFVLDWLESVTR